MLFTSWLLPSILSSFGGCSSWFASLKSWKSSINMNLRLWATATSANRSSNWLLVARSSFWLWLLLAAWCQIKAHRFWNYCTQKGWSFSIVDTILGYNKISSMIEVIWCFAPGCGGKCLFALNQSVFLPSLEAHMIGLSRCQAEDSKAEWTTQAQDRPVAK